MINEGDRVTGVPAQPRMLTKYPTVTGTYGFKDWEFMGEKNRTEFVIVGKAHVDCDDIRPATRRDVDTEPWV